MVMKLIGYLITGIIVLAAFSIPSIVMAETDTPWRLGQALALPPWLSVTGSHRTRFETLDSQFRAGGNGGDQILVMRTTMKAEVHSGHFSMAAEVMDSRATLDDNGTVINTGIVNPAELLQAYLQWQITDVFSTGSTTDVRMGRITMDVGDRRLVARNRYRNTINAFSGIDWRWQSNQGTQIRAFYTLPVNRKPNTRAELADNDVEFDEQDSDVKFWGLYYATKLGWGDYGELFYFGLDEKDSADRPTRNRDLSTLGLRIYRKPQLAHFDYQFESAFQIGESRTSTAVSNITNLDHRANFQHAEIGYTFASPWHPRLIIQYDHATGDDNPADTDNERFDTLFGARRFDFGPTGIYGPFARANLSSPGIRLQLKPSGNFSGFIAYRGYWLASDTDAWTTSKVRDESGDTGSFIGQQIEVRIRWNLLPNSIRLETGIAHLFAGEFMDDAPGNSGQGDATYFYSQVSFKF